MLSLFSISLLLWIMSQYNNKIILKALFFAPSILQLLLACLFIVINHEFSMQSILTVCGISMIIYMLYCVIVIPITYAISLLLSRRYWLNFFTIMIGSLLMWLMVMLIAYFVFTRSFPSSISTLISAWYLYGFALFVGCCYWSGLKFFSRPIQPSDKDQPIITNQ